MLQHSYSNNNSISRNIISNNWDGIMIFNACRNNSIYENDFGNNTCAINITWNIDYHDYQFTNDSQILTKPKPLEFLFNKLFDLPFFLRFKRNEIRNNNFIDNKEPVSFDYDSFFFARWRGNYWSELTKNPYPIYGTFNGIPWINVDWFPASEPYEIEV